MSNENDNYDPWSGGGAKPKLAQAARPTPMTVKEVRELLSVTLHGPLPDATARRMLATLAAWEPVVAKSERVALELLSMDMPEEGDA